jgi:PAS domain S-box-containing protein
MVGSYTDISERKEMETRLQQQLAAIDAASDGIGVADAQGVYIYLNQTHARIFGYAHPDELLGRNWEELYPPQEVELIKKEVFPQLQSQGHWQGEAIARRKDGSLFEQEFSLTIVEHIGLICVCRDITARKKQERLIVRQNQQEHLLRDITARIRRSLELKDIFQTTTQETRRLIQADRVAIFKFKPQTHYNEGQFVAESVAPGWDSLLAVPLQDHCFGDRFAPLYQQGRYQVISDLQKTELEACHRQVLERFQIRANLVLPIVTGSKLWGLLCIHQCSGPRIWQPSEIKFIQQIANQLAIALQQAMLVAHLRRELSQRRQAQRELEQSYHHLELSNLDLAQANRRTEEFLAAMSHELRTPLNSILGVSQALQEKLIGDLNPRQVKSIETIFQSGEHLLALINDILDLSKVRAGKLELQLEPANLQELCQVILQMIRQLAFKKNINLQCHLPSQPLNFWCDSRRLRQVLLNLLNNAVKFTPKGGTIDFTAELLSQSVPPQLRFTIKDTGIGISAENQTKLFQPFVQIDSRLNRQYEGTGLGLALVKRLTELHGGQVEVESAINQGSCFTVSIPYRACQPALIPVEIGDVPFPGHTPLPTTEAPLILVAEDNIANRESLENYLEYKGYRLVFAENGEEALAMIHEHRPDLVLMDVQMPVLDGIEATRRVRLEPEFASLPIIALTALTMPNHRQMCLEAGMNEYMSKPIQFRQLVLLIEKLLAECPAPK